jgi:hypothetical protein
VLPRDAGGQPINPLLRFPENDTSDQHNVLEDGELVQLRP